MHYIPPPPFFFPTILSSCAENKRTLLHYAAEGGKVAVGEYLVTVPGIQIDARDHIGDTPLHVALRLAKTSEIHEDFALMLVKHGADIQLKTKGDKRAKGRVGRLEWGGGSEWGRGEGNQMTKKRLIINRHLCRYQGLEDSFQVSGGYQFQ